MRQWLSFQEHSRRGNAASHPVCRAAVELEGPAPLIEGHCLGDENVDVVERGVATSLVTTDLATAQRKRGPQVDYRHKRTARLVKKGAALSGLPLDQA